MINNDMGYDGRQRTSRYVVVRDGTRLAIDVIRPTRSGAVEDRPLPVIWIATQYQRARRDGSRIIDVIDSQPVLMRFLYSGYVVVVLDIRGTGASFGTKNGSATPQEEPILSDFHDVANWIGTQPWCSGAIGMWGASFVGATQLAAATALSPYLKCIVPEQSVTEPTRGYMNINGIQNISFRAWTDRAMQRLNIDVPAAPVDDDTDEVLLHAALDEHRSQIPSSRTLEELRFSDSWSPTLQARPGLSGFAHRWPAIVASGVAIYHLGSWQDLFADEVFKLYGTLKGCNPSRVVVGPWYHTEQSKEQTDGFDYAGDLLRWYDRWLKGIDNGIDWEPPILLSVGDGEGIRWRTAERWPLPGTRASRRYLCAGPSGTISSINDGRLGEVREEGDQPVTVDYTLSTTGLLNRYNWFKEPALRRRGMQAAQDEADNSVLERRALTFTSAALREELTLIGHPVVCLQVRVRAPDLDFFAILSLVTPAGRSIWLTEGMLRASNRAVGKCPVENYGLPYHPGLEHLQSPLPPGEAVELAFELLPISRVIPPAHRLRLTVFNADRDNWNTPEIAPAPTYELLSGSWIDIPVFVEDCD